MSVVPIRTLPTVETLVDQRLAWHHTTGTTPSATVQWLEYVQAATGQKLDAIHSVFDDAVAAQTPASAVAPVPPAQEHPPAPAPELVTSTPPAPAEDFHAFMARVGTLPPLTWLVPGLIPDEGIVLFHGQPRDFKSFCALELALALACGRPAFHTERFTVRDAVPVVYFGEEDHERRVFTRLAQLTARTQGPAPGLFTLIVKQGFSFDDPHCRALIEQVIGDRGARVAFFDPMSDFSEHVNRTNADLHPVRRYLRHLQNTTPAKTLGLVHHDAKPPMTGNTDRSRSQQASGGGIFSISDCPVAFRKLAWNRTAVYPEDFKDGGNPLPFEVTFESDTRESPNGPQFGTWVRPVAVTKPGAAIDDPSVVKVLAFLRETAGTWHDTAQVNSGAHLAKDAAGQLLKRLFADGRVQMCTGDQAKARGRHANANLWSDVSTPRP